MAGCFFLRILRRLSRIIHWALSKQKTGLKTTQTTTRFSDISIHSPIAIGPHSSESTFPAPPVLPGGKTLCKHHKRRASIKLGSRKKRTNVKERGSFGRKDAGTAPKVCGKM